MAGKKKQATGTRRVNFDMETDAYEVAKQVAHQNGWTVAALGREFLNSVVELGTKGAKSAVAKAAMTIVLQDKPLGTSAPPGSKPKPEPKAKKIKVAAKGKAKVAVKGKPGPKPKVSLKPKVLAKAPVKIGKPMLKAPVKLMKPGVALAPKKVFTLKKLG